MAIFHVYGDVITKGKSKGGAQGFARYLDGNAERMQQYMELGRQAHGREDLVESGAGSLPRWAKDGHHFFIMADRFERAGGRVARTFQISLPRELSERGRLDLATDIREVFFARYPHVYAVHNPVARTGGEQPHIHIMFSPRREDHPACERTPKAWFSRAANEGRDTRQGGVRKDETWNRKVTLQALRYECAGLINAALEREGIAAAVSSERLQVRGLGRRGNHYDSTTREERRQAMQVEQVTLHRNGTHAIENLVNLEAWRQQKLREGIRDISRGAMVDFTRNRFWRDDHSEAREHERQQSVLRAIEREYERAGKERDTQDRERVKAREKTRQWQSPFRRSPEDGARQGVHVQFDRESA